MKKKYKWVFFGNSEICIHFLEKLKKNNLLPSLVVCGIDKKRGRKQILSKSCVSLWAEKNKIEVLKPKVLDENFIINLKKRNLDFAFVLSYGKIFKKEILDITKFINFHPSLLPKYRGASPIVSTILNDDKKTGISFILLSEKVDSGPIVAKKKLEITEWQKKRKYRRNFSKNWCRCFFRYFKRFCRRQNRS